MFKVSGIGRIEFLSETRVITMIDCRKNTDVFTVVSAVTALPALTAETIVTVATAVAAINAVP